MFRGRLLEESLRTERIAVEELLAAVRGAGAASLREIEAVAIETDGTLSVIRQAPPPEEPDQVMEQVRGSPPQEPHSN